ncbi:MAG: hypothetical protein JNM22_05635 [Saprospiraceae bacterium]|nr:hypothetical protein [Saprospiraceae bacterium]
MAALAATILAFAVSQFGHLREWYMSLPRGKRIEYAVVAIFFAILVLLRMAAL